MDKTRLCRGSVFYSVIEDTCRKERKTKGRGRTGRGRKKKGEKRRRDYIIIQAFN